MDIILKYRDYLRYEKNYSSLTEISYCKDLDEFNCFLRESYPEIDLLTIDSDIVRGWVVFLMSEGFKATSVNRKLSSLKSFYRYLSKLNLIDSSFLKKVSGPKSKKPIPAFINDADMASILSPIEVGSMECDNFEEIRNRTIVELFYMTGLRRAELIALKDEDLDFERKYIVVFGKRKKQRIVPLSDNTMNMLKFYLSVKNREIVKQNELVFVRNNGMPLYPMLVYRIVVDCLKMVKTLQKRSPHVLRHTFATGMLNNSASLSAVKELLGHSSLSSTEIYTHTSFEELKKIYNQAHPRA